ncbi:hypothetical protein [Acidovorax sp.]|uniref:hypothetical protein n=1 Tax=Acidovorax sp. TaxID=1872122 RepID=UPI002ACD44C9|nr:hypothetical protein [Acidovorax sp.]MDZ7863260.1 hypothetical protein [Acidovorax sp.]
MLMATHEMALARDLADRVLFMVNGEIVEDVQPARRFFDGPASDRGRQFLSHHLAGGTQKKISLPGRRLNEEPP